MTTLHLPSPANAAAMIRNCLEALPLGPVSDDRREQIVNNCFGPIVLLIEAVELAGAAGPDEEAVMIQCIRNLFAQAEIARRESYLANLLGKLSAQRHINNSGE